MHSQNYNTPIRYPFNNHIMFAKVMKHPEICREFIQRLFPGRQVSDIKLSDITSEASVLPGVYSKSVRFDVLFNDDESWYNIEMQVARENDLPQRGRYYSAAIDVAHLKPGSSYDELKKSYVIFICSFDYYKMDEPIYTFKRFDENLQLNFGDGSFIILLNTKCSKEKIPKEFKGLFQYIDTAAVDEDDLLVDKIHRLVLRYQSDKEVSYMATMEDEYLRKINKTRRDSLAEGHAEGLAEGHASMQTRLNKLNLMLAGQNRTEELIMAAQNTAFQQQLLEEFGLI